MSGLRRNLFSSPTNAALTIAALYLLWVAIPPFVDWALIDAHIHGTSREACAGGGACWVFIKQRLPQFIYGLYPESERGRVDLAFAILISAAAPLFVPRFPAKRWIGAFLFLVYPVLAGFLFTGGVLGYREVPTNQWGGLMLGIRTIRCRL